MKNTKAEINDTELEKVNGGIFIVFASNIVPTFDPVPLKPDSREKESGKNALVPIPY